MAAWMVMTQGLDDVAVVVHEEGDPPTGLLLWISMGNVDTE